MGSTVEVGLLPTTLPITKKWHLLPLIEKKTIHFEQVA